MKIGVDVSVHSSPKLMFRGPRSGSGGTPLWFSFVGALVLQKNSKILLCIFLEEEPGPCPRGCTIVSGGLLSGLCMPSIP